MGGRACSWPRLSLRGQADAAGFVATFSGSHRYVLDYLTEEVLERQTEQVRGFLLETSVLERLSAASCAMRSPAAPIARRCWRQIEAAGLFLVPLDEVRGWWRYHQLFADLLRARLQQEQPGRVAGAAPQRGGLVRGAWARRRRRCATRWPPGMPCWAARLIEQHFDAFLLRGEGATVQRWLAALPAELVRSRPRLCLAQAFLALVGGDVEAAEPPLDAAERAFADAADEPFEPSVGRARACWRTSPRRSRSIVPSSPRSAATPKATAAFASRALAEIGEGEWMLDPSPAGTWPWPSGCAAGWPRPSARLSSSCRPVAGGRRALPGASGRCHHLGQVQRAQGRLDAAPGTYQQALEITAAPGRPACPARASRTWAWPRWPTSGASSTPPCGTSREGIPLCRQLGYTQPLATGLATLAWIRQARVIRPGPWRRSARPGGPRRARRDQPAQPGPGAAGAAAAGPGRRRRGRPLDAASAASAADDEPGYPQEPEYLVLARVLLAQDRPGQALRAAGAAARRGGRPGPDRQRHRGRRRCRRWRWRPAATSPPRWTPWPRRSPSACPQGYVRVFADEGAPMRALLGRLVAAQRAEQAAARGVPLGCLARLLQAFGQKHAVPGSGPSTAAAVPGLVEPLTARELEVLRLLAAGTPNQRIAEELVVTLDTVKKHVSHLLGKLGAANRTEAVTRARQLGLIP